MNPLFASALGLQQFFQARRWRFCFIGGLAVQRWGEPRLTLDVDCSLLTGFGGESVFIDELLTGFTGRRPDARAFALRYRVLLLNGPSGVPADIALAALPFEERVVDRATPFAIGDDQALLTCSAEDLIVLKAFAGRPRDWLDIEGIALRQPTGLNRADPRRDHAVAGAQGRRDVWSAPRAPARGRAVDVAPAGAMPPDERPHRNRSARKLWAIWRIGSTGC